MSLLRRPPSLLVPPLILRRLTCSLPSFPASFSSFPRRRESTLTLHQNHTARCPPGLVIPEKAEIHRWRWIPAFAGMTGVRPEMTGVRPEMTGGEPGFCDTLCCVGTRGVWISELSCTSRCVYSYPLTGLRCCQKTDGSFCQSSL